MSELFREVWEMGHIVHPNSMQNKVVKGDDNYVTREIINYSYCLTKLFKVDYLFWADPIAKEWANMEFQERVSTDYKNPGEAWELRRNIWEEFLVDGKFEYSYNDRMLTSIKPIVSELIKNTDSRQAIISIWDRNIDPLNIGGNKRVPCSMYYQILIRKGQVNIIYNQRSADIVTHFGNDVYLAWQLMLYIADAIDKKPGYLFHNIGSLHSYKKDWPTLKRCISELQKI
jgi:thymidylate synthase